MLGVSRASAGEMLKRLEAEGLVQRGENKEAILTPAGRERAEQVVRKHRIVERLLTDFMGYTPAEAHVHADEIGESFSDDMIERVSEKLGHPDRCPHGWPVDTDFEQAENRELAPLADLEPGARAEIVRLAEHDGDLLHWFYDQGFVPGATVEVRETQPAAEQLTVRRTAASRRSPRRPPRACSCVPSAEENSAAAESGASNERPRVPEGIGQHDPQRQLPGRLRQPDGEQDRDGARPWSFLSALRVRALLRERRA